ncbi:uncharacterized protein PV09_02265 [Verruconis gallopava]|uniref:Inositol polyphosphate-related phosphatase domain-containing protein n=1 Tax=Verruconis gallopava TaxID=253628 RepID=A0A0D2B884_9PEZI|nr:uncharacterized protein PV09_02265 [Verruconis gallopava]KIW07424.1 hypothetical protein PV09_02265 [Verruconis gallopava]
MEGQNGESQDNSSLKPVSSLRNHFENMIKSKPHPPQPSPALGPSKPATLSVHAAESYSRGASLDIPRTNHGFAAAQHLQSDADKSGPHSRSGTPKLRPLSMGPLSPPRSPPLVTVDSPSSPPKPYSVSRSPFLSAQASKESLKKTPSSRSGSPTSGLARPFKIPSRTPTPALDTHHFPPLDASPSRTPAGDPQKSSSPDHEPPRRASPQPHIPPPVNRAGKPKSFGKPAQQETRKVSDSLAPSAVSDKGNESISPFSTPPSEHESPHASPSPPRIPNHSKPRVNTGIGIQDGYFSGARVKQDSRGSPVEPPSAISDQNWTDKLKFANRRDMAAPPPKSSAWTESVRLTNRPVRTSGRESPDLPEDRPSLPARHDNQAMQAGKSSPPRRRLPPPPPSDPPIRKSMDVQSTRPFYGQISESPGRASMDTLSTARSMFADANARFQPPPRRAQIPASNHGGSTSGANHSQIPASRPSSDYRRPETTSRMAKVADSVDDSEEEDSELPTMHGATLTDYPDSSQTNRRPPRFRKFAQTIQTKYETKLLAVCGEYICTSGYITKVWNLLTGELIMSLVHGETIKVTAIAFKPATDVDDEGKRIWLGTNEGDLHEIDIPSESSTAFKSRAHLSKITRIHRHGSEMWTLDEQGTLCIWPPGDDGLPSLELSPHTIRLPNGATYSITVGYQLWVAFGRELMVYQPDKTTRKANPILSKPLVQANVGDVTAAAIISSRTDVIYFGHADGKVTMYNLKDYSFAGMVNISLYKISCLAGVGDRLWAGFNTGMIYVYDTTSQPWKVLKDWRAHKDTIAGVVVDRTSIWKLDRLQVASLGTDNKLQIWDGMLEQDWLEQDMQNHDMEYCDFRELSALVMTWNAGASKPMHLKHDEQDSNFFRDLLRGPKEPPDFVVFGFQELVDLEDKKVTAKNLFKSSKKKDSSEREHMAKQYRAWRDHLSQCLDMYMPSREAYTLLHSADLVGLFTCVFVKSSLRSSISDVSGAEVKLGMKGRYGNKGALLVRFLIDDSSVCFINCHLAAGQKQTHHRNNDIAAIMEAAVLRPLPDPQAQFDVFVSGGDGSMILDHEICILNGDLNYRIDAMSRDIVIREIQAGNLQRLLEKDQLLLSRKRNPGFRLRAFQEKELTFPPTYKYDVGTDNYDTSEKRRSPAWCDRLLYRGIGRIKQTEYRRHEVRVSDHRPVSGQFRIRVKTIDRRRQGAVRQKCEERFEDVRQRIAQDIKLDYLVSVLGLSKKEAERLLKK